MERWENRYANGRSGNGRTAEHARKEKIKTVAIILMAVMLLGVGISCFQAIAFKGKVQDLIVARAMTECSQAVGHVNSMSRSGGSDTAGVLGKIRANINAIDVLSGIRQSLYGQELAPRATFTQLYSVIDSYSGKLLNGSSTIDVLTNLADGLTGLQTLLTQVR